MTIKKGLLLFAAGSGVIVTAVLSAKNAPEAAKRKEAALLEKRERLGNPNAQLTWVESFNAQIGCFLPAIAAGALTLGSIAGSEIIGEKNLNKVKKSFDDYKDMTDKLTGKDTSKVIERAVEQKNLAEKNHKPWEEKEQFRLVFQGKSIQFESTRSDVIEAFYNTNRYFRGRGVITFNEFLSYLGQEPVLEGDDRGWECYTGETIYGYTWIDFGLMECEDEPWVTEIYFPVYPHFLDESDCEEELDKMGAIGSLCLENGANDGEP